MSLAQGLAGLADPRLYDLPAAAWETWAERRQRLDDERRAHVAGLRTEAVGEIAGAGHLRVTAPIDPSAPDRVLPDLARRRADFMLDAIATAGEVITREWLNDWLRRLEARPFEPFHCGLPIEDQLSSMVKRICCPHFWRREVCRTAVRKREGQAQREGRVSVRTSQPYVTNETAARYDAQAARNRAILERTTIEAHDGEKIDLWTAVMASVANPAIRRGELMTRIRGAEEWATAQGMVGIFTTHTAPSRFHAMNAKRGTVNHRYTGGESRPGEGNFGPVQPNGPRDAQKWLCGTWAKARSKLKRDQIEFFGFRVAEPHHDGCPHWHMLLWVEESKVEALKGTLRSYWLADHPDEDGAVLHRFKAERIDPAKGGACAYVAKYIAKNIDDEGAVGAEGHRDDVDGEQIEIEPGGNKARRVMAWASAWGIRQFQAIGQPPVVVFREIRRIEAEAVQGMSPAMQAAHRAVNRDGERRVCWRSYMDAQGGAMTGRDYQLRLALEVEPRDGRYGKTVRARPVAVYDRDRPEVQAPSNRRQWRPVGTWGAAERDEARKGVSGWARDTYLGLWARAAQPAAQPWTRVINCTQRRDGADLFRSGIAALRPSFTEAGGLHHLGERHAHPPNHRC